MMKHNMDDVARRGKALEEKYPGHSGYSNICKALTNAGNKPLYNIGDTVYYISDGYEIEIERGGGESLKLYDYCDLVQAVITGVNIFTHEKMNLGTEDILHDDLIRENTYYCYTLESLDREKKPFQQAEFCLLTDKESYYREVISKLQEKLKQEQLSEAQRNFQVID